MKPGTINRTDFNTRRSKSLCARFEVLGKKEIGERKSLFKAPHSVSNIRKSNLNQSRGIPKPVNNGLSNSRSSHAFKSIKSKNSQTSSSILRPRVDMLAARKRMFERTLHLKQNSGNTDDKNSAIKDFDMQKLNLACTPKQSALTKVYLKLTESAKKSARSRSFFQEIPTSPYAEGEVPCGKNHINSTATVNNSFDLKSDTQSDKPSVSYSLKVDKSKDKLHVPTESRQVTSFDIPDFSDRESKKNISNQSSGNCALNNILKHCELYCTKISSIIDATTCLDNSFQRFIVEEIGGNVYSKFCQYQKKKLELYREMKVIEEELETAVRNETDVQAKFKDYRRKKLNIWREDAEILEEFKSTINCIIEKYEGEVGKTCDNNSLHELVRMLSSSTASEKNLSSDKPVLRRSRRLLTPKRVQTNDKSFRVLRSNSGKKNVKGDDDLIIKGNTKSNGKKSLQRSIYKDLQKSFNLYSPECSF